MATESWSSPLIEEFFLSFLGTSDLIDLNEMFSQDSESFSWVPEAWHPEISERLCLEMPVCPAVDAKDATVHESVQRFSLREFLLHCGSPFDSDNVDLALRVLEESGVDTVRIAVRPALVFVPVAASAMVADFCEEACRHAFLDGSACLNGCGGAVHELSHPHLRPGAPSLPVHQCCDVKSARQTSSVKPSLSTHSGFHFQHHRPLLHGALLTPFVAAPPLPTQSQIEPTSFSFEDAYSRVFHPSAAASAGSTPPPAYHQADDFAPSFPDFSPSSASSSSLSQSIASYLPAGFLWSFQEPLTSPASTASSSLDLPDWSPSAEVSTRRWEELVAMTNDDYQPQFELIVQIIHDDSRDCYLLREVSDVKTCRALLEKSGRYALVVPVQREGPDKDCAIAVSTVGRLHQAVRKLVSKFGDVAEVFFQLEAQGTIEDAHETLKVTQVFSLIVDFEGLLEKVKLLQFETQLGGEGISRLEDLQKLTRDGGQQLLEQIGVDPETAQAAIAYLTEYFSGYDSDAADNVFPRQDLGLPGVQHTAELDALLEDTRAFERLCEVQELPDEPDLASRLGWKKLCAAIILGYDQAYIYGGFVRDYIIRNEEPNDIDVRIVGNPSEYVEFFKYLEHRIRCFTADRMEVVLDDDITRQPKQFIIHLRKLEFDEEAEICLQKLVSIDVSFSVHYEHADPPKNLTDCSPNNLKITRRGGLEKKSAADPMTIFQVCQHVVKKEFTRLVTGPEIAGAYWQGRFGKLIAKGYTCVDPFAAI